MPAQGQRPKVLFIGESSGNATADAAIRQVADVHWIEGMNYEDSIPVIKRVVEEHGPFVAFGGLFHLGEKFPMKWDERLLGPLAPVCKLYVGPGAGYDKVNIDWITSTGAMYANSPLAVGQRTADGALMLLLSAMRGLTAQDLSVRSGRWKDTSVRTVNWREATVGILGLGNIGQQLARMCGDLGMKVIYHNRSKKPDVPFEWVQTVEELYARSDCLVLTCPLNESTKGMINRQAIEKMKDGVIIVNIARGEVIDEDALVEALESRKVMRAALDVFTNEPNVHPGFLANKNVTLSPHNAAAPDGMGRGMNAEVIDNVLRFLETGSPQTPVNLKELKLRA